MTLPGVSLAAVILEHSLDALVALSPEGRVLSWNWGASTLLGIKKERVLDRPVFDVLGGGDIVQELRRGLQEARQTGSAVFEAQLKPRPDADLHVMVILRSVPAGPDHEGFVMMNLRDVTGQKRLEEQLFQQIWSLTDVQSLLKSVVDSSTDFAIVATDLKGRVQMWNAGAQKLFGLSPQEAVGRMASDVLLAPSESEQDRLSHAYAVTLGTGRFVDEFDCASRSGRRFPARVVSGRRSDPGGETNGYVLILQDIADEREAAEALRRKTAFVALLQNVAVAANEAQSVEEAMQRALDEVCAVTGWPVGHVYVRSGEWTSGLTPTRIWHLENPDRFETFRRVTEAMRFAPGIGLPGRVLSSGKPAWVVDVTRDDNFPRARLASDIGVRAGFAFPVLVGTEIVAVLEFFADRALAPDDQVLEVMGHIGALLGRVVERHRAQEERKESLERVVEIERLQSVQRFKEQFIRTISHELNTPITPLKLQLHVLRSPEMGPLSEPQRKSLSIVERSVERLALLVQDMLDVARIQSGQLQLQKSSVQIEALMVDAAELFAESARQNQVRILLPPPSGIDVEADARRILQVLVNLLSNALKFTPAGGQIQLETRRLNAEVLVRVTDSGRGLTKEQVDRLFRPFSQVHDPSNGPPGGTGLGLFICKNIVEQHGGRMGVESAGTAHGTTFWFTVPLRQRIHLKEALDPKAATLAPSGPEGRRAAAAAPPMAAP